MTAETRAPLDAAAAGLATAADDVTPTGAAAEAAAAADPAEIDTPVAAPTVGRGATALAIADGGVTLEDEVIETGAIAVA